MNKIKEYCENLQKEIDSLRKELPAPSNKLIIPSFDISIEQKPRTEEQEANYKKSLEILQRIWELEELLLYSKELAILEG